MSIADALPAGSPSAAGAEGRARPPPVPSKDTPVEKTEKIDQQALAERLLNAPSRFEDEPRPPAKAAPCGAVLEALAEPPGAAVGRQPLGAGPRARVSWNAAEGEFPPAQRSALRLRSRLYEAPSMAWAVPYDVVRALRRDLEASPLQADGVSYAELRERFPGMDARLTAAERAGMVHAVLPTRAFTRDSLASCLDPPTDAERLRRDTVPRLARVSSGQAAWTERGTLAHVGTAARRRWLWCGRLKVRVCRGVPLRRQLARQPELVSEVLSFLPHRDLLRAAAVSRLWRACALGAVAALDAFDADVLRPLARSRAAVGGWLARAGDDERGAAPDAAVRALLLPARSLRRLDSCAPAAMGEDTLARALAFNPRLELVRIARGRAVTSRFAARLARWCPCLRELRLEGLGYAQVDTVSLCRVVRACPLEALSLHNTDVSRVGDDLLKCIALERGREPVDLSAGPHDFEAEEGPARPGEFRELRLGGPRAPGSGGACGITPPAVVALAVRCRKLQVLQLPPAENVRFDMALEAAARHTRLEEFAWSMGGSAFPRNLTDVGLLGLVTAAPAPNRLRALRLRGCPDAFVTTNTLVRVCASSRLSLREFTLHAATAGGGGPRISSQLLLRGLARCEGLERLSLGGVGLTTAAVAAVLRGCPRLDTLRLPALLPGEEAGTGADLAAALGTAPAPLALRVVALRFASPAAAAAAAVPARRAEDPLGLAALAAALARSCPRLERFKLASPHVPLGKVAFSHLAGGLPTLRALQLQGPREFPERLLRLAFAQCQGLDAVVLQDARGGPKDCVWRSDVFR